MTQAEKEMTTPAVEERYAVKFRQPFPKKPGVAHIMATDGVDAMKQGEAHCRKIGAELMSVIPDPEQ